MVDKNLFLYDLAVVAIMKNEAPYVKEWLDYHLAAGVDHFYIYDNESPDNFKEILQPYINAGIVTYKFFPGVGRQIETYIEAYKTYRFLCRYIAFIDADEFIFPKSNKSIAEVTDEILAEKTDGAGIEITWMMYGSNNLETADYSKGVLERFTLRAKMHSNKVKTVANPRRIKYLITPHYMEYFSGIKRINVETYPEIANKILINHYQLKSREEFLSKNKGFKGDVAYGYKNYYHESRFTHEENNDVFDDSILAYRDARQKIFQPKRIDYEKLINALIFNLAPILSGEKIPAEFFEGKLETFLTCRALATYLKENFLEEARSKILEQASLQAVYATMFIETTGADMELLLSELPNLLPHKYSIVKEIRRACRDIIPQIQQKISLAIDDHTKFGFWRDFNEYDNLYRILKAFESYE